ncbi:MAG: 3-oxoacyl-[acyl-carrier-protein] synthase III C-terminal domain-containing protein [Pseudomonadota bacterium]
MSVKIDSVATYLPKKILLSEEFFNSVGLYRDYGIRDDWMDEKMGIHERRAAPLNTKPSTLAIRAAEKALRAADIDKSDIGAVYYCGMERDQIEPATAHTINHELELSANCVLDISNACFGFFDGIEIASAKIESGYIDAALIVTGETQSLLRDKLTELIEFGVDKKDLLNFLGFYSLGDAGAAMVLTKSDDERGFKFFSHYTKSNHRGKCYYNHKTDGGVVAKMDMPRMVANGFRMQQEMLRPTLERANCESFDWLLTHQTGIKNYEQTCDMNAAPREKVVKTFDRLGNVTSATLPVTMNRAFEDGRLKRGDKIGGFFAGSGLIVGQFLYQN